MEVGQEIDTNFGCATGTSTGTSASTLDTIIYLCLDSFGCKIKIIVNLVNVQKI